MSQGCHLITVLLRGRKEEQLPNTMSKTEEKGQISRGSSFLFESWEGEREAAMQHMSTGLFVKPPSVHPPQTSTPCKRPTPAPFLEDGGSSSKVCSTTALESWNQGGQDQSYFRCLRSLNQAETHKWSPGSSSQKMSGTTVKTYRAVSRAFPLSFAFHKALF